MAGWADEEMGVWLRYKIDSWCHSKGWVRKVSQENRKWDTAGPQAVRQSIRKEWLIPSVVVPGEGFTGKTLNNQAEVLKDEEEPTMVLQGWRAFMQDTERQKGMCGVGLPSKPSHAYFLSGVPDSGHYFT